MLLAIRLWIGKKIYGYVGSGFLPAGVRISPRRWIKWCKKSEAEAMEFVAANTTIPIPRVYQRYKHNGRFCIEAEYVKGEHISRAWRKLNESQKRSLMEELGGYIQQLRDLPPPETFKISSTLGGPCRDIRVSNKALFGPFDDIKSFHDCLRGWLPLGIPAFNETIARVHSRPYELRYTHGDLSIFNILVHDGKIAAIIDWECSGWFPQYWEWTRAHYNVYDIPDLYEMLWEQMDHYDEELEAERSLWKVHDHPLDQQVR